MSAVAPYASDTATTPDPGIAPVPESARRLGAFDVAVLWGDLGIGLLVMVTGAFLVPALGLGAALTATVVGSIVGVALLAAGAHAGASAGVPTMVLLRPVLGIRGSWIPTVLNLVQLLGWTAVELWAISTVADVVVRRAFGWSARPMWLLVFAIVCTGLALWGPVGVTRAWLERFGAWIAGGICLVVTILVLTAGYTFDLAWRGNGAFGFGTGLDLVIAMPISWLPLVADYTRFARSPREAGAGTFWGYLLANVWLYTLGVLLVLGPQATPDPAGIATGILALAGGTFVGVMFLVGLLTVETDEAFANIYSSAVSLQNLFPRVPQRIFTVLIGVIGAGLALVFDMLVYERFLFLIGSVFVPLSAVLLADFFVLRRQRLDVPAMFDRSGPYRGTRWRPLVPWLAGFVVYHWINPSPVEGWMSFVGSLLGEPLSADLGWLPASLPAFGVAFLLTWLMGRDLSSAGTSPERGDNEDRSEVRHVQEDVRAVADRT